MGPAFVIGTHDTKGAELRHVSRAGDEGYPGTLPVLAIYTLTDDDAFVVDFHATTDAPTPVSLTLHPYFNLAGHDAGRAGRSGVQPQLAVVQFDALVETTQREILGFGPASHRARVTRPAVTRQARRSAAAHSWSMRDHGWPSIPLAAVSRPNRKSMVRPSRQGACRGSAGAAQPRRARCGRPGPQVTPG